MLATAGVPKAPCTLCTLRKTLRRNIAPCLRDLALLHTIQDEKEMDKLSTLPSGVRAVAFSAAADRLNTANEPSVWTAAEADAVMATIGDRARSFGKDCRPGSFTPRAGMRLMTRGSAESGVAWRPAVTQNTNDYAYEAALNGL